MVDSTLWNTKIETRFFEDAPPEKLFYSLNSDYYAYVPKTIQPNNQTLQSRNTLIGQFTEKWVRELFAPIASKLKLHAVSGVVCDEIGLSQRSSADLAFCTSNAVQQSPQNIKIIFEIKMSIVSNYKLNSANKIELLGDYKSHRGNPSLLRSDSMLKAIGKSVNIRVSGSASTRTPIIVLGNSPIKDSYISKVDFLKTAGVVQGFWSLYPNPTTSEYIKQTPKAGFYTINNVKELTERVTSIASSEINYFSCMLTKIKLSELIRTANQEASDEARANKFLKLVRGEEA